MSNLVQACPSSVEWVQIDAPHSGQRLDNFLHARLKGVPKSHIYRVLRTGQVRVNGGRRQAAYRLSEGDVVRLPPVRKANSGAPAVVPPAVPASLAERILYEDSRLLVLNKPSGIAVHGGSGLSWGVIEALRAQRPRSGFLELAHRLDRDTSGCLLVAKRRSALRKLHGLQRRDAMRKRYLALLVGHWGSKARQIAVPLQRNVVKGGERMVQATPLGKTALTRFRPVCHWGTVSLLDIELATGRTHQIRVHAAYAGHPVAGDDKYGDRDANRDLRRLGLHRLFLHAHELVFTMPDSGERLAVRAPLDPALVAVLDRLGTARTGAQTKRRAGREGH
jgi:23S rRNA pseudouridine955/2504/2580 synthase